MKMRIWLSLGLLCVVVAAIWAYRHSEPAAKAPARQINIRTQTVTLSLAEPTLKLVGKLTANRSVIISPEVTGRIVNIAVQSGQTVARGETLIALDSGKQQAELAEQSARGSRPPSIRQRRGSMPPVTSYPFVPCRPRLRAG